MGNQDGEPYKIYRGKMHAGVWEYLRENKLATTAEGPEDNPWSIHIEPQLGEAIMCTIAIAPARAKGLDIVTSNSETHNALLTQSEDEVFDVRRQLLFLFVLPHPKVLPAEFASFATLAVRNWLGGGKSWWSETRTLWSV